MYLDIVGLLHLEVRWERNILLFTIISDPYDLPIAEGRNLLKASIESNLHLYTILLVEKFEMFIQFHKLGPSFWQD
jgi:hypothetical protein